MTSSRALHLVAQASLLVALLFLAACREQADTTQAPLQVRTVTARAVTPAIARAEGSVFLGILRGDAETNLSFKVNGQIARIGEERTSEDWREGTSVSKGTVLAQIDTANFVNTVRAARARADLAKAMYQRNTELFNAANLSRNEYEASIAQKDTAEADLAQAEQALKDTTLTAPYDGIILARYARNGEYGAAGKPVLRLGDFHKVRLELGVPETILTRLAIGQRTEVSVTAYEPERFLATITEIGNAASEGSRLFRVVLSIDNTDGRLKSGMTATARLGRHNNLNTHGVYIPLSALISPSKAQPGNAGTAVFVVDDKGVVHERVVTTGDLVSSSIIITEGLKEGEQVVTTGAGQLFNGAKVDTSNKE